MEGICAAGVGGENNVERGGGWRVVVRGGEGRERCGWERYAGGGMAVECAGTMSVAGEDVVGRARADRVSRSKTRARSSAYGRGVGAIFYARGVLYAGRLAGGGCEEMCR